MATASQGSDRVLEVREAFSALARSLKRISIYRHAREQHAAFLEPALATMRQLLDREGSITVEVEPTALLFEREEVYSEPAREWSLCFRLHRDGIRSLTFRRGVVLSELLIFIGVALPDPQGGIGPSREDAVTELWKADLESISYTAISGYRMEQTEEDKARVLDAVVEVSQRARRVLDRFAGDVGFADEEAERGKPALWTAEQRKAHDPEAWADLARHAALIILQIVEKDFAGKDLESLAEAFGRLVDEMIERSEPVAVSVALEKLRALSSQHADWLRGTLGQRFSESWRVARVVELCGRSPDARAFVLPVFLWLLPPTAGPSLLDAVEMETLPAVRADVAHAAAARIQSCRERYEERIRKATPEVARALLGALDVVPSGARAAVAVHGLSHRALNVQLDAVAIVGAHAPSAIKHLPPLLVHPDASIRTAAATVMGSCAPLAEDAARALLSVMNTPEFQARERAEQTVFCRSLGRLATNTGFAWLSERLQSPKRGLFAKKTAEEAQLLAVQGLAAEASPRALRVLEHAGLPATGNPPAVAAASRAAANYVRNAMAKGAKPA